jgi:CubicO group peptidase (beta-lactamase class C family)
MVSCLKRILPIFNCVLAISCGVNTIRPAKTELIEQLLDSLHKARIFNGAIVITDGDSILFSKGYGYANFKDSIPFTENTVSDGGSLAKTFTVITLRQLEQQGKITLTDPVTKYLPLYPYPATLVLDLVTHNAGGIPDYDYFFSKISDTTILTNELILSLLSKFKPALRDSTKQSFNYENCGMDLAVLIIEKITGKTFQQVLSEFYLSPLNMRSTAVRPPYRSQMNKDRAVGYVWKNDSLISHDIVDREGFYGGGNVHFTTTDLCKWGQSFYRDKFHDAVIKEGSRPARVGGKISALNQLNWYYAKNKKAVYYWGNVYGFYSHLYHNDEKKFSIAFMTNTTLPYALRQPLAASLAEIMETGDYDKKHFQLPDYIEMKNSDTILGNYLSNNADSIHIFRAGNMLRIQRNNELRYNVFIVDPVTGYVPGLDAWIEFSKENERLILHWNSVFLQEKLVKIN